MKNFFKKFSKKKENDESYKNIILPKIKKFQDSIKDNDSISFLHYGHLGDIINSLPVIKELSNTKKCFLYIQKIKKFLNMLFQKPSIWKYIYGKSNNKMLPLLQSQKFIEKVEIYNNQEVNIDLNFFRELPINFNIDSVRWYSHLTGKFPDLSNNYIEVPNHEKFKNYIVIMRSLRRQNKFIDYSFLSSYKNLVFVGLKSEFENLKTKINNLEYYDSKDFLELASIIKNARIFIGNLSFGYALAEAIKVPRLLESAPNFPLVYPNGYDGYDFYFQVHFEEIVKKLNDL